MAEETRRFLSAVVLEDKTHRHQPADRPYTYVDTSLAKYYGFGAATGTEFRSGHAAGDLGA